LRRLLLSQPAEMRRQLRVGRFKRLPRFPAYLRHDEELRRGRCRSSKTLQV
jgi:hypothetical protein